MPLMQHISIGGLNIHNVTMQQAVGRCLELAASGGGAVYTPNAEMAKLALDDPAFLALLNRGDLVVPDGAGVVLAAKLLGTPLAGKVAGVELAQNLLAPMQQRGLSLFLFGGKPGVAQRAAQAVRAKYPGLAVCGVADGYFDDEARRVSLIAQSGADVVFVCLGSPKQEYFIDAHRGQCHALMLGLGGTLDILAGEAKRAPAFFVEHNLEWLYRGAFDVKRWKRLMKIPAFLADVSRLRRTGEKDG